MTDLSDAERRAMEEALAGWQETHRIAHATKPEPVDFRGGFIAGLKCGKATALRFTEYERKMMRDYKRWLEERETELAAMTERAEKTEQEIQRIKDEVSGPSTEAVA